MTNQNCKKCRKSYNSLADGLCFYCDYNHWYKWFDKWNGDKK
jgi:hypothetical protein